VGHFDATLAQKRAKTTLLRGVDGVSWGPAQFKEFAIKEIY
jgi:hypothetical protein